MLKEKTFLSKLCLIDVFCNSKKKSTKKSIVENYFLYSKLLLYTCFEKIVRRRYIDAENARKTAGYS
jgi:hypothetical protein